MNNFGAGYLAVLALFWLLTAIDQAVGKSGSQRLALLLLACVAGGFAAVLWKR